MQVFSRDVICGFSQTRVIFFGAFHGNPLRAAIQGRSGSGVDETAGL
jgi:hypothetical protein